MSKNTLAEKANLQWTQLNAYSNNKINVLIMMFYLEYALHLNVTLVMS